MSLMSIQFFTQHTLSFLPLWIAQTHFQLIRIMSSFFSTNSDPVLRDSPS